MKAKRKRSSSGSGPYTSLRGGWFDRCIPRSTQRERERGTQRVNVGGQRSTVWVDWVAWVDRMGEIEGERS